MLRITRQTDYGVILLTHLAERPGRVYNAPELAAETGLPVPMAGKVLKILARAGLLASQRGARGGYILARSPEAISVAEVITALEGPIALTDCLTHGPGECGQLAGCPTRGNWHQINAAVQHALARISLAEMARPAPAAARAIPAELHLPILNRHTAGGS